MKASLVEALKRPLIARLKGTVAFLLYCETHSTPQVRGDLVRGDHPIPYYLRSDIRAIGDELVRLGGLDALREAIAELDPSASEIVNRLWRFA